ncbi:GFA family protein [Caldimonas brevitalea]|uniref:Aldehyde-activating protein n=1 Tax=Caldimonas brevitalea TaxID=413882 RepID=A0A0G3BNW2_9BURK|nr:GFA family protein [Caldimonas brevitalea]AKJ28235.1 aldehyde-activating protein [Caldimonas brevitalea]
MQGSCLCGAVRYEVTRLDSPIQHCACRTCRKAHSAAFNTAALVKHEHFKWLQGEASLKSYESSPGKLRYFCGTCGSQLVAQKAGRDTLVLRVASLDDDPGAAPQWRIWTSHQVPWLDYTAPIPSYPEWDPSHR